MLKALALEKTETDQGRRSRAARNAALASSTLSATPPFGPCVGARVRQRVQTLRDRQCGPGPYRSACGNRKLARECCGDTTPARAGDYRLPLAQRESKAPWRT